MHCEANSLLKTARPLDSHTDESLELTVFMFFFLYTKPTTILGPTLTSSAIATGLWGPESSCSSLNLSICAPLKTFCEVLRGDRRNKSTLHNYVCSLKSATNISIRHILQSKYSCDNMNKGCQFCSKH